MAHIHSVDDALPAGLRGAAAALGNFDGVHKGHRAVLSAAGEVARARRLMLAAAVFEPHPRQVLCPDEPPFRLQSPLQRRRALAAAGAEAVFEIRFDAGMAALTDEEFARIILADRLGVAHVETGADFTFGRGRMGDAASLTRLGAALAFTVETIAPVADDGARYSSSAIRDAIRQGGMDRATALLGRPWAVEGLVLPGQALGRTIGYPTANLGLGAYVRPRFGVYTAIAFLPDGGRRPGVASCGLRPTVTASGEPLLETHLFDFAGDLYGRRIEVELISFLRPELKFDSVAAMREQIARDEAEARALLGA